MLALCWKDRKIDTTFESSVEMLDAKLQLVLLQFQGNLFFSYPILLSLKALFVLRNASRYWSSIQNLCCRLLVFGSATKSRSLQQAISNSCGSITSSDSATSLLAISRRNCCLCFIKSLFGKKNVMIDIPPRKSLLEQKRYYAAWHSEAAELLAYQLIHLLFLPLLCHPHLLSHCSLWSYICA